MANSKSVQKAHRSALKKQKHNLFWKNSISDARRSLVRAIADKNSTPDILREKEISLQKALDKAAKTKAIHKNKASRLKSRYAKKVAAQLSAITKASGNKDTGTKKSRGKSTKSK